jgi:hypothetical protein
MLTKEKGCKKTGRGLTIFTVAFPPKACVVLLGQVFWLVPFLPPSHPVVTGQWHEVQKLLWNLQLRG